MAEREVIKVPKRTVPCNPTKSKEGLSSPNSDVDTHLEVLYADEIALAKKYMREGFPNPPIKNIIEEEK
ncbi:hypothetical protein EalM132_00146 [Exiguobacterium phage vB_EalM-132]|nr:hypothetical protein EalM132_00146 [Exiguobacterium phage vB_EalM-132]